ncbi:MAG: phage tail sheath subtilisin-like domain-containing protein [Burkholderiaceae bacterium]
MQRVVMPEPHLDDGGPRRDTIAHRPTGVCAFVGPTPSGPVGLLSPTLRSFAAYQAIYGGLLTPEPGDATSRHLAYMGHAAHAFFAQGGQRLHVLRVDHDCLPDDPDRLPALYAAALERLDEAPDISLVAMPATMALATDDPAGAAMAMRLQRLLLDHVSLDRRHRMAILDVPADADARAVLAWRAPMDTAQAAMYHPWLVVADPASPTETMALPPSGFVCGIYARSDALRGIHRAPANDVLHGVLRLARPLSHDEQALLNAQGVNSLRTLAGLGTLVWGARTLSREPAWIHVSVRRHFNHLRHAIEQGLSWVVFEPNGEALWSRVRSAVSEFLAEEWRMGGLAGQREDQAFYVRCDRSTMTPADERAGRLVCHVGLAQTRPSEFRTLQLQLATGDWSSAA